MSATENISIVIGSWGSYNECNERALGSNWLDLTEYEFWEDIEEELKKQGFELDGIDEELFVQDIENLPSDGANWITLVLKSYSMCLKNPRYWKTVINTT